VQGSVSQLLLQGLSLADVADDGEHEVFSVETYSVRRFDRVKAHLDPDLCAILAPRRQLQ
jgi:hypothetical protein